MWAGPLHEKEFVEKLQQTVTSFDKATYPTRSRILGMLSVVAEVFPLNLPSNSRNWTFLFIVHLKMLLEFCMPKHLHSTHSGQRSRMQDITSHQLIVVLELSKPTHRIPYSGIS